jgi:hypothetical protein
MGQGIKALPAPGPPRSPGRWAIVPSPTPAAGEAIRYASAFAIAVAWVWLRAFSKAGIASSPQLMVAVRADIYATYACSNALTLASARWLSVGRCHRRRSSQRCFNPVSTPGGARSLPNHAWRGIMGAGAMRKCPGGGGSGDHLELEKVKAPSADVIGGPTTHAYVCSCHHTRAFCWRHRVGPRPCPYLGPVPGQ